MEYRKYPKTLNELIALLKTLPGVGPRSAARLAFAILKWPPEKQAALEASIAGIRSRISPCPHCGNISEDGGECVYCADKARDPRVICVVEHETQIPSIESSAFFRGMYHVLGGRIAPLERSGPEQLRIRELAERVDREGVAEVILALGQDVEGQATAIYIADLLKGRQIKVTRLARGLPAGSDITYADSATVAAALAGRMPV